MFFAIQLKSSSGMSIENSPIQGFAIFGQCSFLRDYHSSRGKNPLDIRKTQSFAFFSSKTSTALSSSDKKELTWLIPSPVSVYCKHVVFARTRTGGRRIMYLMGGLDRDIGRYIGRCIGRYICRYSDEYRSILGRQSVEYRLSIGRVSVYTSADMCVDRYNCNRWRSADIPYRHSVDTRSVYDLKSIWRRTCPKKGAFRFRIFFFCWHYQNVIPSFRRRSIPVDKKDRHRTCRM